MNQTTTGDPFATAETYGATLTLDELVAYFGQSLRAVRAMLRRYEVPVVTVGNVELVQAAQFEAQTGFVPVAALLEDMMLDENRAVRFAAHGGALARHRALVQSTRELDRKLTER